MKQYFLLRNNSESGPFTRKELKAKGLFSADLIWIEGESNCWKNPEEIAELSDCLREAEVRQMPMIKPVPKVVKEQALVIQSESGKSQYLAAGQTKSTTETGRTNEVVYMPSFKELQKKYSEKFGPRKRPKNPINISGILFGFVVLALSVTVVSVMVKKAFDNLGASRHTVTGETKSEKLPQSATVHTALSPVTHLAENSIATEGPKPAKPIVKPEEKKEKNLPEVTTVRRKNSLPGNKAMKVEVELPQTLPDKGLIREASAEAKFKAPAQKFALQIAANDYSVGLFGGISNLELSITNPSSQTVEQAIVEIEYVKNNGKVVGSKTVEVSSIAPGATKKVSVPDNSRGMQVRYHAVNE